MERVSRISPQFWLAVVQIIIIDILLAGDNAVVIALACRNLPPHLQTQGHLLGRARGAIVLRIILTAFAATLLTLPWLKLIGGVLLLWIGVKLIAAAGRCRAQHRGQLDAAGGAIKTIIIADFVMSLDNVIGGGRRGEGQTSCCWCSACSSAFRSWSSAASSSQDDRALPGRRGRRRRLARLDRRGADRHRPRRWPPGPPAGRGGANTRPPWSAPSSCSSRPR